MLYSACVVLGLISLALVAALSLRRQFAEFHEFVRSITSWQRALLAVLVAGFIAYGGSKTNSPPLMLARPPARPTVASADIARGWQFVETRTNENVCYTMPVSATLTTNWWVRGACDDVVKTGLGGWRFPFGTNAYSSLWAFSWGKVRFRLDDTNEIAAVGSPISAVPYRSRLWTLETNNAFLVTWENFAQGRIRTVDLPQADRSPLPHSVNAQLELHRSGDFVARSNAVETAYRRVCPEDWDDDGIPNDDDANPYFRDGDFFGPRQTLPDEANEGAYCWVEIAADVNTHVVFTGDGESDLPDPDFMLRAGETNRVTLLIGKTYTVESAQPLTVTDRSDGAIEVGGNGSCRLTIVWPVSVYAMEGNGANFMMRVVPNSIGGEFEWTDDCCPITGSGRVFSWGCNGLCLCTGCTAQGVLVYEGYSIPVTGGHCGCSYGPRQAETEPDDEQMVAGVSASFSPEAVIFEDAYTNKPGSVVYGRSTEAVLSCTVHGGFRGGTATFSFAGETNLVWIRGAAVPQSSVTIPPGEKLEFAAVYEGLRPSEEAEDITYTVTFTENDATNAPSTVTAKLTSVKVELETVYQAPENRDRHRHWFGVGEDVRYKSFPVGALVNWSFPSLLISREGEMFMCPWVASNGDDESFYLDASIGGVLFRMDCRFFNPKIKATNPRVNMRVTDVMPVQGEAGHLLLYLDMFVEPLYVSFQGVDIREIIDDSHNCPHAGYYCDTSKGGALSHDERSGAGVWNTVTATGYYGTDRAGVHARYEEPWLDGYKEWPIPMDWGMNNVSVGRFNPNPTTQRFELRSSGRFTIKKFHYNATREVSGETAIWHD